MRTPTVVILATAALAAVAPPASATITSAYTPAPSRTLTVTSNGDGDTITLSCPSSTMLVNGANPDTGPLPCTGGSSAGTLIVIGNGGADTLDVTGVEPNAAVGAVTLDGGEGDDSLTGVYVAGPDAVVSLLGGAGNDRFTSNSSDIVRGGPGDDRLIGSADVNGKLEGEDGTDTFAYDASAAPPVSYAFTFNATGMTVSAPGVGQSQTIAYAGMEAIDLALPDGGQTADASQFEGSLRVDAGGGADTITGTTGADVLNGGPGNDFIDGGGGADVYQGGGGLDLLHARDGVADTGDCGADEDTLVADAIDALVGCERVELPVVVAPPDTTKPVLGVRRATLRNRRLRLPVSCPATETRCAGIVTLAAVGRRKGASVRVRLGAITLQLAGGQTKTLSRRVSRGKVRALGRLRGMRLRVSVDVLDAAGNRTKAVRRVRLRR
jgi:hypothetical protein